MKRTGRGKPKYPRIECSVEGCKRGSTIFEPGTMVICGKCWRRAPKDMRQRFSWWRRTENALKKRGDPRFEIAGAASDRAWNRILAVLNGAGEGETLPPLIAEELRKDGLL